MSDLLRAFDLYSDFQRDACFTHLFEALPSTLAMETPLKGSRGSMEKVTKFLELPGENYELILKHWLTKDSSDTESKSDYPYQMLFKSIKQKSLIWVSLENDNLYIEFLFDCKDLELESWIVDMNHRLRQEYGLAKKPTFKVLIKGSSRFKTDDVKTEPTTINLSSDYNDDFVEIDKEVKKSFEEKKSGLILFYGTSGTGKTTYIKSLITQYSESNFIFVQNEFVSNLLDPEFISFLLKHRDSILIIEDAEKVISSRKNVRQESVVSTVLQLTDGLFSDYLNIKIICTFNTNLSQIDSALLRKGRMISMYEFKALELLKTNKLLKKLGGEQSKEELTLSDIYNNGKKSFAGTKKRKIGF